MATENKKRRLITSFHNLSPEQQAEVRALYPLGANVVAMLPVGVCAIIGVLTKRDLEEISWSVLWMVAGGFALGVGLQETGLAQTLINAIPFGSWPALVMVVGSGLICYAMANFISHTATASLLVPILAAVGGQ